jgi:hypothetical protein
VQIAAVKNCEQKTLRLPVSLLKQCMVRTFMFIFPVQIKSGRLEYNSLFVGLGAWGVRVNEPKICQ